MTEHPLFPGGISGMIEKTTGGDGVYRVAKNGVRRIVGTADDKLDFILYADRAEAYVKSTMGYPALYPLHPARLESPVKAVLMDLDGTSVHSEAFWVWIIEQTTAQLLENKAFRLESAHLPFVSGHSVSEHLSHCIRKYAPDRTVEEARKIYFETTRREMQSVLDGTGKAEAFTPAPGLKEFLLALRERHIKIGVVTSGLYEKAWPELVSAFRAMGLGNPQDFYDAIITAGFAIRQGQPGTLGELQAKPHPWLYAEAARVGLGLPFEERHHVLGIEDSGAGAASIRLAGFAVAGLDNGNIMASGARGLCHYYESQLDSILNIIDNC